MLCAEVGIAEGPVVARGGDIRRMLLERRRELLNEIQSKVRDAREAGSNSHHHVTDPRETVDAEPEDDMVFALIQMRVETLARINEAIRRVDDGTYGHCGDCGGVIAPLRLRAMPFAVRCRECEEMVERNRHCERVHAQRLPSGLGL